MVTAAMIAAPDLRAVIETSCERERFAVTGAYLARPAAAVLFRCVLLCRFLLTSSNQPLR
jgi:hypothetical protein